jgi:putative ABC transport system permease protein
VIRRPIPLHPIFTQRRYPQGRSPLGTRVVLRGSLAEGAPTSVHEIVGVARQVKGRPDETEDLIQVDVPIAQVTPGDIFLLVSAASGRAEDLTAGVRSAIARHDANGLVSVRDVETLDDVARGATSRHRFRAALVASFAGLALALAMVGVFGVLAYSVQQRVREIGVRRALGATTRDVLRLIAGAAARVIGAGAAAGVVLSILLGRLLSTMLFNVEPLDPVTFAAVASMVAIAALLSIAAPMWRATRVDPAIALRAE